MNIETIRAFLEVVSTGSFQQAADNLYITQSTMSARIKGLEERLNRPLFQRTRHGVVLTTGGHKFLRHATTMVKAWEHARLEITLPDDSQSVVTIGFHLNVWPLWADSWFSWMTDNHPQLATQARADASLPLINSLKEGLVDLVVVHEPQQSPQLAAEFLGEDELVLVSSEARHVEEKQVPGYIYVDWGESFRTQHNRLYPEAPYHRIEISQAVVALAHIERFGGSGYFPRQLVIEHLQSGRLTEVGGAATMNLPVYLVCLHYRKDEPTVQAAVDGLKAIV
ncbi:HTH-type transcriptional regulator GltC [Grimontia celer]|uniref:HTH-type transcriptional regulator GltC n=1 Tax=Grimontia celer TaxID=1796497 RepID=A0A128F851_9GAMM|nr:LysR family transcriptional regulator [Grimontia celer]CZF82959.1 HTH-type transcriptional regulator GltC [Grimontia celer]